MKKLKPTKTERKTKLLSAATRKKQTIKGQPVGKEVIRKEYDTFLYLLDMCKECKKMCKVKAITGSRMIYCPDTTINIKAWRKNQTSV